MVQKYGIGQTVYGIGGYGWAKSFLLLGVLLQLRAPLDMQRKVQWDLICNPPNHASCHATSGSLWHVGVTCQQGEILGGPSICSL